MGLIEMYLRFMNFIFDTGPRNARRIVIDLPFFT